MDSLIRTLAPLPHAARRSITFDRGTEFTDWPHLQAGLGVQPWFCDLQSPWQKGIVENTNRRARRWLNRDVDPLTLADRDLRRVCDYLNSMRRKCLGYRTPAEVFLAGSWQASETWDNLAQPNRRTSGGTHTFYG